MGQSIGMTDTQLYLAIALPSFVALVGILVNVGYFVALNRRVDRLEDRVGRLEEKFDTRFDLLIGKVSELDTRVIRIEDKLGIVPR